MAGHRPVLDLGRTLADEDHVHEVAGRARPSRRAASSAAAAQTARQLGAQGPPPLHEQRLVDRLVRHPHLLIVRMIVPQTRRDLLGRPAFGQEPLDLPPQATAAGELGDPRSLGSAGRARLGQPGSVAAPSAVGRHLARDGRGRPSDPDRDLPERLAGAQSSTDLFALCARQPKRRADRHPRWQPTRPREHVLDRPDRATRRRRDIDEPLTGGDLSSDLHALPDRQRAISLSARHPRTLLERRLRPTPLDEMMHWSLETTIRNELSTLGPARVFSDSGTDQQERVQG